MRTNKWHMRFPEDCIVQIQYRENKYNNTLQSATLTGSADQLISEDESFKLYLRSKKNGLYPQLIRKTGKDVYIENLSMNLVSRSKKKKPVSIHSSIPNSTSFHVFKQGYQSSSISNFRSASDLNAWQYHRSSSAINPEQKNTDSLHASILSRLMHFVPRKGHINSDGMVCLEEICEKGHVEWGNEESELVLVQPRRIIFYASRPGQQSIRFFIHLDSKTGYLKEFNIIWDFSGRLLLDHARVPLTPVSWILENTEPVKNQENFEFNVRRSCSHLIIEHQKKIGNFFHTNIKAKNHIRAWCAAPDKKTDYEKIKANLEAIKSHNIKLSHFVISACSTIDENGLPVSFINDFSLHNIAKEIERYGLIPAIRFAPFLVQVNSRFIKRHPEMILRNIKNDKPVIHRNHALKIDCYCLDTTHPRFRNWIKKNITSLVKTGFRAIYLDQMTISTRQADYYNKQSSAAGRLRESLLWIKRAAGRRAQLLSSDCPLWPAIGLVDIMQISQDTGQKWQSTRLHKLIGGKDNPATRKSMINIINHAGMHNQLWSNAPGPFTIFQNQLSRRQRSMVVAILALSGGSLLMADDFYKLVEEELAEIKKLIQVNQECAGSTAVPLAMCEKHFPRGLYNPAGYIGLWNPTEHSERIELPIPGSVSMQNMRNKVNLWSKYREKATWRLEKDRFSIALSPYETIVIKL